MMLKVDTKERFVVIRLPEGVFSVNVSDQLTIFVTKQLSLQVKNIIVDFADVISPEKQALTDIATLHQLVYKNKASFVICNVCDSVKKEMEGLNLLNIFNITPTESEAWDIVQMEEIERELLGDEDF